MRHCQRFSYLKTAKRRPSRSSVYTYSRIFRFAAFGGFLSWFLIAKVVGNEDLNGVFRRLFIGIWLVWAEILAIKPFTMSRK